MSGARFRVICENLPAVEERLANIEAAIQQLHKLLFDQRKIKGAYTPAELADILGKKPYTVREWCRFRRIHAKKTWCGRGAEAGWGCFARRTSSLSARRTAAGASPLRKAVNDPCTTDLQSPRGSSGASLLSSAQVEVVVGARPAASEPGKGPRFCSPS